jgi:ubiquitin thioesterase OTU1
MLLDDSHRLDRAPLIRRACADHIMSHTESFNSALLGGKEPTEYAIYIQQPSIWGGGIEMRALAEHFQVRIVGINVQSRGGMSVFGEDQPFNKCIYVIYDGLHYDAICRRAGDGSVVASVFSVEDTAAMEEARQGVFVW